MSDRDADDVTTPSGAQSASGVGKSAVDGFLPSRPARPTAESVLVRLIATAGVVAIGTAVGAIIGAQDAAYWVVSLVVSLVSVVLAAVLWRSSRL